MIDRSQKPKPKGDINFSLPQIKELTLSNELKVNFVEKSKLPIVQFSVLVNAGSKFDPAQKSGLAYLTSMLIDEGAAGLNALEIDNEIELLGSVLKIHTNKEIIKISLLTLKENIDRSFRILSDIIQKPSFSEEDFERCKKELITKILQSVDDPSYLADTAFTGILTTGTPYSKPTMGFIGEVENISRDDVKEMHRNFFTPGNMRIICVGDTDERELENLIKKYFSLNGAPEIKSEISTPKIFSPNFYLIDKPSSAQSEIRIGHISGSRGSENYYSKKLMNLIFGGQFSSRIMSNLREDKGYTYGASSFFSYFKSFSEFEISTAVQTENTVKAIKEIFKELEGIQKNISDEEVEYARSYISKRFPSEFQTNSQIASNISSLILHSLPLNYYESYLDKINAVTKQNMMEAANKQLLLDKMTVVIVGDKKSIKKELEDIFSVGVIEINSQFKEIN